MRRALDERDRIRAAMERMLSRDPTDFTGTLTVTALAAEAGVSLNALTRRHIDLKNEFNAEVRARRSRRQNFDGESEPRPRTAGIPGLLSSDAQELKQLRADVEALVGALNRLHSENRRLRRQLAEETERVRALSAQVQPRPGPPSDGR